MSRLRKADAEVLMDAVDTPLLLAAVAAALRRVLDVDGFDDDWPALVRVAGELDGWPEGRCMALVLGDEAALADLAVELNERRSLGPPVVPPSG